MVKFTVKQKLQALNLLKEGYSSHSVAQMIGTGSHQLIDTWAVQYQHFGVKGLEIRHTQLNLYLAKTF
ncbi:helix-turn-helix domain-containing protein [Lactobacillus kimbladii]|uniref:helix-turn-helix domain-containing protein n=1 Tax=Lactobacillus kimbladii TaxID=1218506 RepID=UPI003AF6B044